MKIGNVELAGRLVLAPMAGVTDAAFRHVCYALGAAMTTTEMVSARALCYGDKKTKDLLRAVPGDAPLAVQIFGHEPEIMAEAAPLALELSGAQILDINMGCPVGKVVKSGDGSALMRTPELAEEIIRSVVKSAGCPVTVKFRKGWDKPELLTPGKIEKYEMEMYFYGMVFKKGHKIRIDISSSELMEAFPNTNTGIDPYTDPKPIKATQTIYHGREYPSHVKLPVLYGL